MSSSGKASGSGSGYPLDTAPSPAHALDDEFPGTSLDGKWTAGLSAASKVVANSWLTMTPTVANKYAYLIRQVSPTGDFSCMAKISAPLGYSPVDVRPGIFMARTTGTKALVCGLALSGGPHKAMWIEHSNYSEAADWGAYNGSWSGSVVLYYGGGPLWFRMRWVSASSTIFTDISADGVSWVNFSSRAGWSQPDRCGIVIEANGGNTGLTDVLNIDWFRVTEP